MIVCVVQSVRIERFHQILKLKTMAIVVGEIFIPRVSMSKEVVPMAPLEYWPWHRQGLIDFFREEGMQLP